MASDDETLETLDDNTREWKSTVSAPGGSETEPPDPGRRVGPYRIERLIAQGGMGAVYLATRQDDFEKRVALKLVRPELKTAEIVRRFAAERQILARLEHPNIASVFDGGTTDDAMPFFVMEYVEGIPVDRYCDERSLSLRRRLELFRKICVAIHFAHQNLVVHRDLKPSNILVTSEGIPKLLDFGIAKILTPSGAEPRDDKAPMTPSYASPEQLRGEAVTTASDVYSLGVLLYRLVSGESPYRRDQEGLDRADPARWVDIVCRQEPRWPSVAAHDAGIDPRLPRRLEGDLDAIVLKAMRKKPEERYASALQLAEDLECHLDDLPVRAHAAGWLYRARKLARRHRTALVVAILVVGLAITSTGLWRRAVHQQIATEKARLEAQTVSDFLERLFESADPEMAQGEALTLREVLDLGREKLADGELADTPEVRAEVLTTLGTVYNNLALFGPARELKEEALRTRLEADPGDRADLASDLNNLARLDYDLGDYAGAERRFREALAMWRRLGDENDTALALNNLANTLGNQGRFDEAAELQEEALELRRRLFGPESDEVAVSLYSLGALHRIGGDTERAEPLLRRALAIYTRRYGREHTWVARVLNSLGRVLHAEGRLEEGRGHLEEALAIRRRILGEEHVAVAASAKNLAAVLLDQGEAATAGPLLEGALATLHQAKPPGDGAILAAESVWGTYLMQSGRRDEAEPILVESYRALREVRGEHHAQTREARRRVVAFYEAHGEKEKAAAFRAGDSIGPSS